MSRDLLREVAAKLAFLPRTRFDELGSDHVPFDLLTGTTQFEAAALEAVVTAQTGLAVVGERGGGKSSLLAYVCRSLPESHVALRVPVTGADDPTSVSAMASVALSQALSAIKLEEHQRDALARARADETLSTRTTGGAGGKLGGGPIPAEVAAESGTLEEELRTNRLATERLAGLDRLISILVYHERTPVFVMEDTEAVTGREPDDVEGFFAGPVKAFLQEVEAPLLIAVQRHLAEASAELRELLPALRRIDIPDLGTGAGAAIGTIARRRLDDHGLDAPVEALISDEAMATLTGWYADSGLSLRQTLAALQSAVLRADDVGAERVELPHAKAAVEDWRD